MKAKTVKEQNVKNAQKEQQVGLKPVSKATKANAVKPSISKSSSVKLDVNKSEKPAVKKNLVKSSNNLVAKSLSSKSPNKPNIKTSNTTTSSDKTKIADKTSLKAKVASPKNEPIKILASKAKDLSKNTSKNIVKKDTIKAENKQSVKSVVSKPKVIAKTSSKLDAKKITGKTVLKSEPKIDSLNKNKKEAPKKDISIKGKPAETKKPSVVSSKITNKPTTVTKPKVIVPAAKPEKQALKKNSVKPTLKTQTQLKTAPTTKKVMESKPTVISKTTKSQIDKTIVVVKTTKPEAVKSSVGSEAVNKSIVKDIAKKELHNITLKEIKPTKPTIDKTEKPLAVLKTRNKVKHELVDELPFTEEQLDFYKQLLLKKREEFTQQVNGLRKKIKKALDQDNVYERNTGDPDSDYITESSEFAKDEILINRLEENIRDIDDALNSIEDHSYGYCQKTGKLIEEERLKTIPWARYSILIQNEIESNS